MMVKIKDEEGKNFFQLEFFLLKKFPILFKLLRLRDMTLPLEPLFVPLLLLTL